MDDSISFELVCAVRAIRHSRDYGSDVPTDVGKKRKAGLRDQSWQKEEKKEKFCRQVENGILNFCRSAVEIRGPYPVSLLPSSLRHSWYPTGGPTGGTRIKYAF